MSVTERIMLKECTFVEGMAETENQSSRISTRNLQCLYIRTEWWSKDKQHSGRLAKYISKAGGSASSFNVEIYWSWKDEQQSNAQVITQTFGGHTQIRAWTS